MIKNIIISVTLFLSNITNAQNNSLAGTVIDNNSGLPLIGAHVMVVGTTLGTATNNLGYFVFNNLSTGKYKLLVSYSGYSTCDIELTIPFGGTIEVIMHPTVFDINQVVVTGTRSPKPLKETPVVTQVISSSALSDFDVPTIETAIERNVAGVEFTSGSYGSSIQMMGLPGNYVVFLKDGNKIAGETNGNIDYNRLSTLGADRIEILRGASSVLYGSNAMAGVINIISKPQVKPLVTDISTRYSNFNTSLIDAGVGVINNNLTTTSAYRFSHTDGYDLNKIISDGSTVERTTSNHFNQKFLWAPQVNIEIEAKGSVFNNYMDQTLPMRNDKVHSNFDYSLRTKYYFKNVGNIEATWHEDNYKTYEKDGFNRDLQYYNKYQNARIIGNVILNKTNNITVGTEQIKESLVSPRNSIVGKTNTDRVFYIQDDAKFTGWLSLTGGLRYNYNTEFENHTTWQLSAMAKYNWLTLRGNLATGFKTPSLKERYMEYRIPSGFPITLSGNENLKPEESQYQSVSAEVSLERINFSINFYRNNIDKMITEVELPFNPLAPGLNYKYQNVDEVKVYGIDILMNLHPINNLVINGGYSYYRATNESQDRQLIGSRNHSGRVNLSYNFNEKITPKISLLGSYYGDIYRTILDENTGKETNAWLDDFILWKVIFSVKPFKQLTITAGIDNIFDYSDKVTFATFNPGRTYFIGLRYFYN